MTFDSSKLSTLDFAAMVIRVVAVRDAVGGATTGQIITTVDGLERLRLSREELRDALEYLERRGFVVCGERVKLAERGRQIELKPTDSTSTWRKAIAQAV